MPDRKAAGALLVTRGGRRYVCERGTAAPPAVLAGRRAATRERKEPAMPSAQCKVCGNTYDKPLEITVDGQSGLYDCFECAMHDLAPSCTNCGVRILGHGVEAGGTMFCGAHCAGQQGVQQMQDRA